jgi:hypothetical protein
MCTIKEKIINKKSVIGYKVAYQVGKRYYSPVTGIEYKPGPVTIPKKYGKNNIRENIWISDVLNKLCEAHDEQYSGKTAVFTTLSSAKCQLHSWAQRGYSISKSKYVILKMELSGELYNGNYGDDVYLGTKIDSIKKVKE